MPTKIRDISADMVRERLDYDPETGDLRWRKSYARTAKKGAVAGHSNGGYVRIMLKGISYYAHRLAWAHMHGDLKGDIEIDHENMNRKDNRLVNLRNASHSNNQANASRPRSNTSGVKGVTHRGDRWNKWRVRVGINKKRVHVGDFATLEEAKLAYYAAASRLHGEFARAA